LTADQLARFEEGRAWFDDGWSAEEGLGPLYLQDRCSSCHDLPTLGGTGVEVLPLVSRSFVTGNRDPLEARGGPVIQVRATPELQGAGIQREKNPEVERERISVLAPFLYGAGLVEALSQKTVHLYSDLLLHDLGPHFRTVCSGDIHASESITARLQGLGLSLGILP
jgi:hypothetical protein